MCRTNTEREGNKIRQNVSPEKPYCQFGVLWLEPEIKMGHQRNGQILFALALGLSCTAFGQGGRAGRAAAQQAGAQQAPAPQTAPAAAAPQAGAVGRGGRGGPVAPSTSEFYDYDTAAGTSPAIADGAPVESHQKITVNGEALAYTARAGYLPLRNATTGQVEGHLFYTCYARDGVSDSAARPLVFFLGGGPGVSAAWQEFGGLGPKRMKWTSEGSAMPSFEWVDNPHTLLGQADLVFVNPMGTGFSRPDQPGRATSFWNSSTDVASLGEFVRSFLNMNNRRNSPVFLAGEDFGTGRAAGLAGYLNEHQIPVHGVALLSMTPAADALAGDAEYITLLPSLVMAAWQHKKLSPELNGMSAEQISGQARQFASREYLHALYKGDRMTTDERTKVVANLSRLTGLSKAFLVNNDLRVTRDRFNTELLREQHHGLSNSDARVSGFLPAPAGGGRGGGGGFGGGAALAIDFNLGNLTGGFATAYDAYLRGELKFNGNGIFYLSSGGVGTFTSTGSDDASLSGAFARNPRLRLFVGVNYFDLNAPFYATEFTLAHLSVSPEVRAHNITVTHYEAGEMPYVDSKALVKLEGDLSRFVSDSAAPARK
jgi:carboxypeptidase C (cathepsin A)